MEDNIEVPFIPYDKIHKHASEFLNKYHSSMDIPVPIEEIIEFNMGLNIVPLPGLRDILEVEGFTLSDLSSIYVDDFVYCKRPGRYRFTLAHEVGHIILHKDIYLNASFTNSREWKKFINSIPDRDHSFLEWHAYAFAGLILVPGEHLKLLTTKHIDRIQKEGISLKDNWDFAWDCIAAQLGKDFEVSSQVIEKRLIKDEIKEEYT